VGAVAIDWPCIQTRLLHEGATRLVQLFHGADWIAVASKRALAALVELGPQLELAGKRWACVGPATAAAARKAGATDVLVAQGGTARCLAQDLLGQLRPGQRVLLLGAAAGRPDFAQAFEEAGAPLDELALYETLRRAPAPASALEKVDAIFFASPSAVHGCFQSGTLGQRSAAHAALAISIGPSTSAALFEYDVPVAAEALERDLGGLLEALQAALAERARQRPTEAKR